MLLLVTLAVGTGQGTATGTKSWLAIGGHQIGQPAELAKLAVILMLARYLSGLPRGPAQPAGARGALPHRRACRSSWC